MIPEGKLVMVFDISYVLRYMPQDVHRKQMTEAADEIDQLREQLKNRDEELLRIRTAQSAAAHSIDNIGVECGLGCRISPYVVEGFVRAKMKELAELKTDMNHLCDGSKAEFTRLREKLKKAKAACRSALDTYEVQTDGKQPWAQNNLICGCVEGTWYNTPNLLKEVLDEQD